MVVTFIKQGISIKAIIIGLVVLMSLNPVLSKRVTAADNNFRNNIFTVTKILDQSGIAISGKVVAFKEITFTAQMPGRIEYIAGEEGSWFAAGKVVLVQNDRSLLAQRHAALSQINSAQTALQNSQVQYNREMLSPSSVQQPMPGMGFPAMFDQFFIRGANQGLQRQADIYSRYTGVSQAQASYQQAFSQLRSIDEKLRDTRVITPFEGVITKKMVEVGDTVQPGQALFTFAHTRYFRVQAEIPARLVTLLHTGMTVRAYLDNFQQAIPVRVANIYPGANNNSHTVTVKFDLPSGVPVASGMYVQVQLPNNSSPDQKLLVIPGSALISGSSLPGVMLLTANNKTELRVLRLGHELQNGQVVVLAGLNVGDRIITKPSASRNINQKTAWSLKH